MSKSKSLCLFTSSSLIILFDGQILSVEAHEERGRRKEIATGGNGVIGVWEDVLAICVCSLTPKLWLCFATDSKRHIRNNKLTAQDSPDDIDGRDESQNDDEHINHDDTHTYTLRSQYQQNRTIDTMTDSLFLATVAAEENELRTRLNKYGNYCLCFHNIFLSSFQFLRSQSISCEAFDANGHVDDNAVVSIIAMKLQKVPRVCLCADYGNSA